MTETPETPGTPRAADGPARGSPATGTAAAPSAVAGGCG